MININKIFSFENDETSTNDIRISYMSLLLIWIN